MKGDLCMENKIIMKVEMDEDVFVITGELNKKDFFSSYDTIFVQENGKPMFKFGKLNQMEFFNVLLSDYLSDRDDIEFVYICDELIAYKNSIQHYSHLYKGEDVPNVVVTRYGGKLELVALSAKGYRYYENVDERLFTVTDETGEPVTDNPAYYLQNLENEDKFLYISDDVKARLEDNN